MLESEERRRIKPKAGQVARSKPVLSRGRRYFLSLLTRLVVALGGLGILGAMARSLWPSFVYEPEKRFKIGLPDQFPEGISFINSRRLFVVREGRRFHIIGAKCTHLGCTVVLLQLEQPKEFIVKGKREEETWEFFCPCHGSRFYADGTNYGGPAPRPLFWFKGGLSPDGQIMVDASTDMNHEFRLEV